MSVVHDVQWEVERRCKVLPEVTEVMKALRIGIPERGLPGLSGKYETAAGLTKAVDILKGLGQGDLASPVRSKLLLSVMQRAISRLVRGFKFAGHKERVPLFQYADDGCFLTDDLPSLQLAFDAVSYTHLRAHET